MDRSITFDEAIDALAKARRGLARWEAWHAEHFHAPFPPEAQQPPDWASWIAAASGWGVAEADRLFPEIHLEQREHLISAIRARADL